MTSCISSKDIAAMIESISGDQAVGADLRSYISPTSSYQMLRDARNRARNSERAALVNGETAIFNQADWAIILNKAPQVIKEESKDIEIVAWLIEALTRNHGFEGLAQGMSLARQLIDTYGEQLYPRPDEDGVSTQLAPLIGLNGFGGEGALIAPIRSIPVTQGNDPGPLASWQCEQAFEIERISDPNKREARIKQGGISREQLDRVMLETETSFVLDIQKHISLAIDEYGQFQATIDVCTQDDPQPTSKIMEALVSCQQVLIYIAGDRLKNDSIDDQVEINEQEEVSLKSNGGAQAVVAVEDRQAAIKMLRDAASFFRRTEPHSPMSYSIEQIIRWSDLPLTDLIKELIPDDSARTKYRNLSGILLDTKNK